jgi:hypothetical protein
MSLGKNCTVLVAVLLSSVFLFPPDIIAEETTTATAFSVGQGYVRLDIDGSQGTFRLYGIDPDTGRRTAVFATRDASSATFFALKIGRSVYRLNRSYGIRCRTRRTDNSAEMIYTISNLAEVTVNFTIMSSTGTPGLPDDMVRVTITPKNTGTSGKNFALRGVFDTILGEVPASDFSTAGIRGIHTEMQFTSMKNDRWIISGDGNTAVQFLLCGRDITEPEIVTMANKDIISSAEWAVNYVPGRVYSSILSYNNSALDISWGKNLINPGESQPVIFYMVLGTGGRSPKGDDFLEEWKSKKTDEKPAVPVSVPVEQQVLPVVPPPTVKPDQAESTAADTRTVQKADVPFDVSKIKKEQLDPEYVQRLIQQINDLETEGGTIDKDRIRQLNAELDAILNILRQK